MTGPTVIDKRPTGIVGFDHATRGGLPTSGATLVRGRPGAGKTVLAMEISARAARRGENAVVVSFEESRAQLLSNARAFAWGDALASEPIQIIDARPHGGSAVSGAFDLTGLRAFLDEAVAREGVSWIVLDGIDQVLDHAPSDAVAFDEIRALDEWSRERGVTVLLTAKSAAEPLGDPEFLRTIEFMLSTVIDLSTAIDDRRLSRRFRITKYRGSAHVTDELPMVIDDEGIQLPYALAAEGPEPHASTERLSTGISALDEILGGGLYRGSTTLLSGAPGTSKTTLVAAFTEAAAKRGERVLFTSFDESWPRIVRNVASVGVDLQPHIDAGLLHMRSLAAWRDLVEHHFIEIHRLMEDLRPDVLVIDPISAFLKAGIPQSAHRAIEQLLGVARSMEITTFMTSLSEAPRSAHNATLSHTSTLADTWITLEYRVTGGERNRALSIVKSRGTAHSNQVRELLLSDHGIDLVDVYKYGTDVLLGTARLHEERKVAEAERVEARERARRIRELESAVQNAKLQAEAAAREQERLEAKVADERAQQQAMDEAADRTQSDIATMRKQGRPAVRSDASNEDQKGSDGR